MLCYRCGENLVLGEAGTSEAGISDLESVTFISSRLTWCQILDAKTVLQYRCGEKLVLGEANISEAGISDLESVNFIAREMVYKYGFNRRLGPVSLMEDQERYLNEDAETDFAADIGQELASIALTEIEEVWSAIYTDP